MAQFILKDSRGKENTFDHETIFVRGVDGELMPFTHGTGNPVLEELQVTENGNYTPSEGVDGFGSVSVNVPDIPAVVQPLEVTENGTYTAPDGVDGYSPLTVNVPTPEIVLQDKTITENGTYTADIGYDGLGSVEVNVKGGGGGLPAGFYWKQDEERLPMSYAPKFFMHNGERYAIAATKSTMALGNVYKFENGAWTTIASGCTTSSGLFNSMSVIEFGGKTHILGISHYAYDPTNGLVQLTSVGGDNAKNNVFVEDGKLKAHKASDDTVYVWGEASDSWSAEKKLSTGRTYRCFHEIKGSIYCIASVGSATKIYRYSKGVLTYLRDVIKPGNTFISSYSAGCTDGEYIYGQITENGVPCLARLDVETGIQTNIPRPDNTNVSFTDKLRLVNLFTQSYKTNMLLYEVTD